MNRRTYSLVSLLAVIVFFNLGLSFHKQLLAQDTLGVALDGELPEYRNLMRVFHEVQQKYVDEEMIDPKILWRGAIDGMLAKLDPYSTYLPAERYDDFRQSTEGVFGGLGIRIEMDEGWVTVVSPLPNTPAFRAGLMPRDRIYRIEDESIRGWTLEDTIKRLKGDPGTEVTISIARQLPNLEVEDLTFTIVRDIIDVPAVAENSGMVTSDIGYIRLNDFTQDAADELEAKIVELQGEGMKGMVLDLRYNSGGLLPVARDVCGLFLPRNTPVVRIEHREAAQSETLRSRRPQVSKEPLVVIVNRYSASASEIVAGCVQDHRRGVIVGLKGENTFGKGSVQTVIGLEDGAALKMTTAHYLTPNERDIHEKGIRPDVAVDVKRADIIALSQQHRLGYLPPGYFEDQVENRIPADLTKEETHEITAEDVFLLQEETDDQQEVFDAFLLEAVQHLRSVLIMTKAK